MYIDDDGYGDDGGQLKICDQNVLAKNMGSLEVNNGKPKWKDKYRNRKLEITRPKYAKKGK